MAEQTGPRPAARLEEAAQPGARRGEARWTVRLGKAARPGLRPGGAGRGARLGETALAGLALGLMAAVVLGRYVLRGGLAWDDWANAATTAYPPPSGYLGPVSLGLLGFRPLLALLLAGSHALLGPSAQLHLGLALLLAVVLSTVLFAVLLELGVGRAPAAAVAALVLVFPWSDSTRLWATAGINDLAVVLWLLGALAALGGLGARGRRRRRLQAAAIAGYLTSILLYQATAVLVIVSMLAHAHRAGRPPAARRRRLALAVGPLVVATAVGAWAADSARGVLDTLTHAGRLAGGAVALLGRSAVPFGDSPANALGALLVALIAVGGVWAWRTRGEDDWGAERDLLRRGLGLAGAGLLVVACAYAIFVPSDDRYVPWAEGTANRVNMVAALGYAAMAVGLATGLGALASLGLARARLAAPPRRAAAILLSGALVAAIGTGWTLRLRGDARLWERAAVQRAHVLAAIDRRAGELGPGSTVLTVGHPVDVAAGIPVFGTPWDLDGAVKVTLGERRVAARPLRPGDLLGCRRRALAPAPTYDGRPEPPAYGRTVVIDVGAGTATRVVDRRSCRVLAARRLATLLRALARRVP